MAAAKEKIYGKVILLFSAIILSFLSFDFIWSIFFCSIFFDNSSRFYFVYLSYYYLFRCSFIFLIFQAKIQFEAGNKEFLKVKSKKNKTEKHSCSVFSIIDFFTYSFIFCMNLCISLYYCDYTFFISLS